MTKYSAVLCIWKSHFIGVWCTSLRVLIKFPIDCYKSLSYSSASICFGSLIWCVFIQFSRSCYHKKTARICTNLLPFIKKILMRHSLTFYLEVQQCACGLTAIKALSCIIIYSGYCSCCHASTIRRECFCFCFWYYYYCRCRCHCRRRCCYDIL